MMFTTSRGVIMVLAIVLAMAVVIHAGGNGHGGPGNGGNNGGGSGSSRWGRGNGWWPWGRGRDNRPPHGGSNCRRWSIPDICDAGVEPTLDRDGCVSCIDITPEIDGCSLDELSDCADTWQDLPYCGAGEWPERSNTTCCYQCRPLSTDKCSKSQVAKCKAAWIGADNSTALPYCSSSGSNTTDTNSTSGIVGPIYDSKTCCVNCRVPLALNMTAGSDGCTLAKFQTCTAAMPVCANGEAVNFDTTACCGSCRRPTRSCDIASVVRCYASVPSCGTDELPQWLDGDCCPSCRLEPLTTNSTGCESCTSEQICIRETKTSSDGNVTATPTCKTRADLTFTITASGKMAKVFALLSANQVRHIIAEYIRRYCDKADNMVQCAAYVDALRDAVISTTIACTGLKKTNGGDRRCDGRWGADGDDYQWVNGSIVANPASCTVTVMISVAVNDDSALEDTSSPFKTQSFMRAMASSSITTSQMIKAALGSDSETLDDGMYGAVTKDTTSGASAALVVSPFIMLITMMVAIIA